MTSTAFNWSKIISKMKEQSSGITTDVTFQIVENGQLQEVKAHKMLLAMVSDTFETMFYSTDVGDKNANVIKVEKTTAAAFNIMKDAIYNAESFQDILEGKSVDEVFDVVNLLERYQIKELMEAAKEYLANYPVTEDTVLEVAGDAMEYSNMFEAESKQLLLTCAKFLEPKLKDARSMKRYAAENKDRKMEFATLFGLMNDIAPAECSNCKKEVCRDGEVVKEDEFVEGLLVTNNRATGMWGRATGNWGNTDFGTGRVTKVEAAYVTVENIKAGVTQNGLNGHQFSGSGASFKSAQSGVASSQNSSVRSGKYEEVLERIRNNKGKKSNYLFSIAQKKTDLTEP